MLKRVIIFAIGLALLLVIAQLALAQQNPDQSQTVNSTFQDTSEPQTTGGGQPPLSEHLPLDPAQQTTIQPPLPDPAQQNTSQPSPPTPDPAQQNTSQTPPPDLAQQNTSEPPPPAPDPVQPNLDGLMHLNEKNELVVDCAAVTDKLTQLQGPPVGSPQAQAMLTRAEDLSHLCAESGFTPTSSKGAPNVPSSNGTNSTRP